ncbi:right-handed parallel beta-helix repeat-containing protein [Methanobrevibacter sp. YE315]|uniref:right-handed parallel beta-helix repeat-containing protein n=1 Tax=Methanobrevibacter sp. YE315 TaxID=1609968 RepID=UPI000835A89D|nr:right-handed parallel beta-helix repeat-containing protein [Methanobrevibacter sp. YE315]
MNKKSLIIAILLVFVVIVSSSAVFAEESTNNNPLQEGNDIATISQTNDDTLSSQQTIRVGSTSDEIQAVIDGLSDGDTLNFENGKYRNVCIYVNKSITINGNGATIVGYDTPSKNTTPEIIYKPTSEGGYAIGNLATFYIVKADGVTINGLNIVGGAHSGSETAGPAYSNAVVYAMNANNLNITNCVIRGSSWGLYLQYCANGTIIKNTIRDQAVTGILNFGSANTNIRENTVRNAKNHGIDVRHGTGPNVKVVGNKIIGSKEGIYLMHSKGHMASYNTMINCSLSAISCYGSSDIKLYKNKMKKSRIGILLGGGYSNIIVKENTYDLDNLPFPPTFVYYVAEAKSDYQSAEDIMGTHSDSSSNSPNYVPYEEIETPADININYNQIMKKTGTKYAVYKGWTNEQIQNLINTMEDGDSITFSKNAVFNDICLYIDKNIKVFGNNATIIGCKNIDFSNNSAYLDNVPEKIKNSTADGGYAVAYNSVLYVMNTSSAVISGFNIKAQYPSYNPNDVGAMTNEYKTCGIYAGSNNNLIITGCDISGASWGIFQQSSKDSIISRNNIHDIYTSGIMNFGSANAVITENTITDALNHGIDVRHGTGPNAIIFNNTISGAKEGIYLMHSKGHLAYNNTILNCKISGITAYGSGNEAIFNNTIAGSRIGILLGGNYYNVTIGENKYNLDFLPFPPTFVTYLAKAEQKYQSVDNVQRVYSDKTATKIVSVDKTVYLQKIANGLTYNLILRDAKNNPLANKEVTVNFDGVDQTVKTSATGAASVKLTSKTTGIKQVTITFAGDDEYSPITKVTNITITQEASVLTAPGKTYTIAETPKTYSVTLKSASGKALAKTTIKLKINGKTYSAVADSKGVANFELPLTSPGNYEAVLTYAGSRYFAGTNATATIIVKN